ncbi:MAG: CDP-glycerol glycerophosphotransferase family protein [Candidatus Paceibacterota bacterium]
MNKTITIFITSFHGLLSRVLSGGVLEGLLKDKKVRIIIFCLDFKKDYYEKEFGSEKVIIEPIDSKILPFGALLFQKIAFKLLLTKTTKIQTYNDLVEKKEYLQFVSRRILSFLGSFKLMRKLFRFIYFYFSKNNFFSEYFDKYKPGLIFLMDCKHMFDSQLMLEAKKRKIKTIGMIRSWDNLTAKGILKIIPDNLIVYNETIKKEAIKYSDVDSGLIYISGISNYDIYTNEKRTPRKKFLEKIKINDTQKIILFAPTGNHYSKTDSQIMEILDNSIKKDLIPNNPHVIVRFPPGDFVDTKNFQPGVNFSYDFVVPDTKLDNIKDNEMTLEKSIYLADLIYHSDVIVAGPSTILVDAIALNKPSIAIGFDGFENKKYYESIGRLFDYSHMSNLISTGAVKLAKSELELIKFINEYLKNPDLNKKERQDAVNQQCFKLDGKSSERVSKYILSKI